MSSTAIYAKVRSMQGNLFTKEDYESLCHKPSLSALIYALQQSEGYKDVMKEASTRLHRGALEALLHHILYERLEKLSRYAFAHQEFFHQVTHEQTICLIHASMVLLPLHKDLFLQKLPSDVKTFFPFDVNALLECETMEELSLIYQDTIYQKTIEAYLKHRDPITLELDLSKLLITTQQKIISKLPKDSQAKVLDYLSLKTDLYHMEVIYRARFYFHYTKEQIEPYLLPFYKKCKKKQLEQLMSCKLDEYFQCCKEYGYALDQDWQKASKIMLYEYTKKRLYMENDAYLAYLCAIHLFQNECDNICAIIEGIRYQKDPETIMSHVIV